ncbi:MAG TPA: N-acetylmuramic acid 6-phosphate etherase [Candidatus Bathyarchaeia archaeon]|nr:N-acetylmuramic acid 6-phosphate etherase [Candidatus Bathyarchaeia archaeon]
MRIIMACDCGATGTRAGLYSEEGVLLSECAGGPANAIEHGALHCATLIAGLGHTLATSVGVERIDEAAAGVSGGARPHLRGQIAEAAREMLGAGRVRVTDDLHPILFANAGGLAAVVVTAGTGSSVLAQSEEGTSLIVGGHGRVLGDDGSGYGVAVSALRAAANAFDGAGPETELVEVLPSAAGLDGFDQLAEWAADASKNEIAALAHGVVSAAVAGDKVAFGVIREQAGLLAGQALTAARRLGLPATTPVFMNGSLFAESEFYANAFKLALEGKKPVLQPAFPLKRRHAAVFSILSVGPAKWYSESSVAVPVGEGRAAVLPVTERRLERGKHLDELEPVEMVRRMAGEDAGLARAVLAEEHNIAVVIEWVAAAMRDGGRLIYVGAGTSGRLGVLDASECPPTFGVVPGRVVGLIAGGDRALRESVELAEDDVESGARAVASLKVRHGDVVVGISASGRTPYVLGALEEAGRRNARTALLCSSPPVRESRRDARTTIESRRDARTTITSGEEGRRDTCATIGTTVICVETGPEVVAGSTRLKAGSATKMVLNMISTCGMARAGYVFEGYMVGVQPVSAKLLGRAGRMISALTGEPEEVSHRLLREADNSIPVAVLMARKGLKVDEARRVLEEAGGSLRAALESV